MSEVKFVDGLIVKAPHEKAPDFVKANISIKRKDLITWLEKEEKEWINLQVKESRKGTWYAQVDEWERPKPDQEKAVDNKVDNGRGEELSIDEIPF